MVVQPDQFPEPVSKSRNINASDAGGERISNPGLLLGLAKAALEVEAKTVVALATRLLSELVITEVEVDSCTVEESGGVELLGPRMSPLEVDTGLLVAAVT